MWKILLLGGLIATSDDRDIMRFRTHKAGALLGYLAFHKDMRPHSRDMLIDLLWPDAGQEAGRHSLSVELSSLRSLLEPPGTPVNSVLMADRYTIGINPENVTTDVSEFERAAGIAEAMRLPDPARLRLLCQAADLYAGPLLPGYYEYWIGIESARLSSLYGQIVAAVAPLLLRAGSAARAITYANRAVLADPLCEAFVGTLLIVLAAMKQTAEVRRRYCEFERRLADELDEEPSEELQALAHNLCKTGPSAVASAIALYGGTQATAAGIFRYARGPCAEGSIRSRTE